MEGARKGPRVATGQYWRQDQTWQVIWIVNIVSFISFLSLILTFNPSTVKPTCFWGHFWRFFSYWLDKLESAGQLHSPQICLAVWFHFLNWQTQGGTVWQQLFPTSKFYFDLNLKKMVRRPILSNLDLIDSVSLVSGRWFDWSVCLPRWTATLPG